ncbi:DUF305 domain-containing protein [Actinoplanes sp. NEAU-A12]|uniref:DUF305 domain-containing protein n=1 Tax=Actinoplanes sandaracinus TaxID=3045177 RepID=A0ABT6WDX2_9ACTN|nr:DUF305 domain-containing protein [Actinoplanes sandaracinus]MDI6097935.1 DUF305 domain-containing protein [Actinoplanes sandaracinus]
MTRTLSRRALLGGAVTLVLAVAACGDRSGGHSGDSGHTTAPSAASGVPSAAPGGSARPGAGFNDADVAFAQHMIVHHQQAVEMSTLAGERAATPRLKELATAIEAAQGPEIATMTGWLSTWGQPVAAPGGGGHGTGHESMPGMMSAADMKKLAAARGAAFDELFLTMMIAHHEGAITMAGEEATRGASPEAKALAAKIVTDQRAEIATMKAMR